MNEVLEYMKKCKTFYIATMEGDQPRVRPFGIAEEFEGKIYIQTGKIKNVSKQLAINPKTLSLHDALPISVMALPG